MPSHLPLGPINMSGFRTDPRPTRTTLSTPVDRMVADLIDDESETARAQDIDDLRFAWKLSRFVLAGYAFVPTSKGIRCVMPVGGRDFEIVSVTGETYERNLRRVLATLGEP